MFRRTSNTLLLRLLSVLTILDISRIGARKTHCLCFTVTWMTNCHCRKRTHKIVSLFYVMLKQGVIMESITILENSLWIMYYQLAQRIDFPTNSGECSSAVYLSLSGRSDCVSWLDIFPGIYVEVENWVWLRNEL